MPDQKKNVGLIGRIRSLMTRSVDKVPDEIMPDEKTVETSTETGRGAGEDRGIADVYYEKVKIERTRMAAYADYDLMDEEFPELSSALDIYADNAIAGDSDEEEDKFAIECEDDKVKEVLEDTNKRVDMHGILWPTVRDICKYGDEFEEIVVSNDDLIVRLKSLPQNQMYRNQDKYGRLDQEKAFIQKDDQKVLAEFEPWQIVHFRNRVSRKYQYGRSILAPARRLFQQLQMMEDGMVVSRLSRAHMRYVHKVDVGELPPVEGEALVERVMRRTKKKRYLNPITGKYDVKSNPLGSEEDFFIGVRQGSPAGIERLEGQTSLGNIGDVEYFQNKMFSVIKVPKSWLGLEKDVSAKAIITNQDVQFARTVRRVQNYGVKPGLRKVYDIALLLQGYDLTKVEYSIYLPGIKTIDEVRRWEVEKAKAEIAKIYGIDLDVLTDEFVLSYFLGLSDEEIKELIGKRGEKESPGQRAKEREVAKQIAKGPGAENRMVALMGVLHELRDIVNMELEDRKYRKLAANA